MSSEDAKNVDVITLMKLCYNEVKGDGRLSTILNKMLFGVKSIFFDIMYKTLNDTDIIKLLDDYRRVIEENKLSYEFEYFDCDDFALLFKAFASMKYRTNGVGLAIGLVKLPDGSIGGHAWNIAVRSDLTIVHIEPQTCEVLKRVNGRVISEDGFEYMLQYVIY